MSTSNKCYSDCQSRRVCKQRKLNVKINIAQRAEEGRDAAKPRPFPAVGSPGSMCRMVAVIRSIIARHHLVMDGLPLIEEITLERHLMAVWRHSTSLPRLNKRFVRRQCSFRALLYFTNAPRSHGISSQSVLV